MIQRKQSVRHYSRLAAAAAITLASMLVAGCRDADDRPAPSPPASGPAISGAVIAAHVSGSRVKAYKLRDDGARDREIGTATTNAAGGFTMTLDSPPSGPIELEAVDGEYDSEADTRIKRTKVRLRALIPSVPPGGDSGLVATPLTTFAAERAMELTDSAPNLAAAIDMGDDSIREIFGIGGDSLNKLEPDITATGDKAAAAVVLGALEDLAIKKSKEGADIVTALAADLSDGVPDGKKDETPVMFEGTTETIPSTLGTSDFLSSVTSYTSPDNDNTDRGANPPPVDEAAVASVRQGVVTVAPPSSGLNAGTSGAITTLSFDGKQVVYVAARSNGVRAVDITNPAAPVVDLLGSLNAALAALPDDPAKPDDGPLTDIGGVLSVPGAATPQLLLFSYSQSRAVLVDVQAQTVIRDVPLGDKLTFVTNFSGGSAFISGGIPDPVRGVIWLAAQDNDTDRNGFIAFNTSTFELDTRIRLQKNNIIPENIGGDISSDLLFAPGYGAGFASGVIELVRLDRGKSYLMDDAQFQSLFTVKTNPDDTSGSAFGIVDGGAVDSVLKIGVLTGEVRGQVALFNMKDMGKFSFVDGATASENSFTVSDPKLAVSFFTHPTGGFNYSGSAVESTNHLALLMAGFSNDILVGRIEDPALVPTGAAWKGFSSYKQYGASGSEYSIAADPHAVGALLAAGNNRSYGFLLSGDSAVLMIDLQAFLDAEAVGTTGGDATVLKNTPFDGNIIRTLSLVAPPAASARAKAKATAPVVQRNYGYSERAR